MLLQAPERVLGRPCLIAGSDWVRVEECRDAVRRAARAAGIDQVERIDATQKAFDWLELAQLSISPGLFANRRLLDLRLGSAKLTKPAQQIMDEILERADPDLQLLVSVPEWSRQIEAEGWIKRFARHGQLVSMWPLKPTELPRWIGMRAQRAGVQLEADALELLIWRTDGNLLAAAQEVEKLALAKPGARWSAATLGEFVADSARFDVFRLVDEALAGKPLQMRRVLHALRAEGEHPARLLPWIARQLEMMVGLVEQMHRERSGARDWLRAQRVFDPRAGVLMQAAGRHSPAVWERLWMDMRAVDQSAKGHSPKPPWLELERLLLRVALPPVQASRFAA
jgi:DNA polymerase-3 subunit delta